MAARAPPPWDPGLFLGPRFKAGAPSCPHRKYLGVTGHPLLASGAGAAKSWAGAQGPHPAAVPTPCRLRLEVSSGRSAESDIGGPAGRDFSRTQAAAISLAFPLISDPAPGLSGPSGPPRLSALRGSICSPGAYFLHHLAEWPAWSTEGGKAGSPRTEPRGWCGAQA